MLQNLNLVQRFTVGNTICALNIFVNKAWSGTLGGLTYTFQKLLNLYQPNLVKNIS